MVNIALAGGTGGLGREVLDVLVAERKHDIRVLTRQEPSLLTLPDGVQAVKVDYTDKSQLVDALEGVETVLCFIITGKDLGNVAQKNLIDACVEAGVKRYAPSEWAGASPAGIPWYAGKAAIAAYLEEINSEKKVIPQHVSPLEDHGTGELTWLRQVLEYSCMRVGLFMDYLAFPESTAPHMHKISSYVDFQNCRAILLADSDSSGIISWTTAKDVANIVARAVNYPGKWPKRGGMRGSLSSNEDLVKIGEEIRGKPFVIEYVKVSAVRAGRLPTSWYPHFGHAAVDDKFRESFSRTFFAKLLYAMHQGSWETTDEWNRIFPDYRFTGVEEFLRQWWKKA